MSIQVFGLPVSRGVAIGRAVLVASSRVDVAHYFVSAAQTRAEVLGLYGHGDAQCRLHRKTIKVSPSGGPRRADRPPASSLAFRGAGSNYLGGNSRPASWMAPTPNPILRNFTRSRTACRAVARVQGPPSSCGFRRGGFGVSRNMTAIEQIWRFDLPNPKVNGPCFAELRVGDK